MALYKEEKSRLISFPLGGIGSGSVGLSGNGAFVDWEIFNRPFKGSRNGFTHLLVKAEDARGVRDSLIRLGTAGRFSGQCGGRRDRQYQTGQRWFWLWFRKLPGNHGGSAPF